MIALFSKVKCRDNLKLKLVKFSFKMISVCIFHTCIAEAFKHITEAYSNLIKNFIMLTKKCLIVLKLMKPQN